MPSVHLSTQPVPPEYDISNEIHYDGGNFEKFIIDYSKENNEDHVELIKFLKKIGHDDGESASSITGFDSEGNPNLLRSIGMKIADEIQDSLDGVEEIYFHFTNILEFAEVIEYLIIETIETLESREILQDTDFTSLTNEINKLFSMLNMSYEDEEDYDDIENDDLDNIKNELNDFDDDDDVEQNQENLNEDISMDEYDREGAIRNLALPKKYFDLILTPTSFMNLLKMKPVASNTRTLKIGPESSSYRIADQGKIFLNDAVTRSLYFVKREASRGNSTIYMKTFTTNSGK